MNEPDMHQPDLNERDAIDHNDAQRDEWQIEEIAIPKTLDEPGASDYVDALDVRNRSEVAAYGTEDVAFTAAEILPNHDPVNEPVRLFVVRSEGRIVARARHELEPGDDAKTCWQMIDVLPEFRQRGIGALLAEFLESLALDDGLAKSIVYAPSRDGAGERLAPPTGAGSVPAANPEVRFLRARGYRLEQVVRGSRLTLPYDIGPQLKAARAAAGPDYVVHLWRDRSPEQWVDDMAMLRTRMSTEEPDAGLDEPEDTWTSARLVAEEERIALSGQQRLVVAVEHAPSAALVGFTTLFPPLDRSRRVAQLDTLVLPEHRGHRLGMLLKASNIDYLQTELPGHPSIMTFNAEENRPMLDVNEAVGFEPIGYEGAWRKDLR